MIDYFYKTCYCERMNEDLDFGSILKNLRKKKQLTLQTLSEETDLSISYLSKLENNLSSPTLINLQRICNALEISMAEMLEIKTDKTTRLIRKDECPKIYETNSGLNYHQLFNLAQKVKIVSMTMNEDNYTEELSWGHHYDEVGIVIEGSIFVTVSDETYQLFAGDVIFIKAHETHKFQKATEGICVVHWIYLID